jgi:large subunit ribosomal protein L4
MELEVYKIDGSKSGEKVKLSPDVFGIAPNDHAIYRAVTAHLNNRRQGTHKVKTRAEVRGGGKKPFKQKHTGMARQGSSRSPVHTGGGSIFGPKPRDYTTAVPEKVRKLARRSALSYKAQDGQITVVEDFSLDAPRSRQIAGILKALALPSRKTLLLMPKSDRNVVLAGRNLPSLNVLEADKASTYDLLNNSMLLIQKSAVDVLHNIFKKQA